jgi:ATP/maltotriose-dependent transcriptional regulator MalT
MRILLVGPREKRARLRHLLPAGIDVVGESTTPGDARALRLDVDAWLVTADAGREEEELAAEALTARELEVLELVAQGLPNKTIAERLAISDQTVKVHVASIYGKLQAANRTDAVRRAVRRGLISL